MSSPAIACVEARVRRASQRDEIGPFGHEYSLPLEYVTVVEVYAGWTRWMHRIGDTLLPNDRETGVGEARMAGIEQFVIATRIGDERIATLRARFRRSRYRLR